MRNKHILLAGLFLLGGMVSAAFAVYFVIKTPSERPAESDAATRTSAPVVTAKAPPPSAPAAVTPLTLPSLDFLRIAPAGGVSVLAGRAKPRSPVTILEGDKVVGWVDADGNGEWSHVTEHVFAPNLDPFQLTRMQSRAVEFDTIDKKVQRGYISKDDGARLLGYMKAFKSD